MRLSLISLIVMAFLPVAVPAQERASVHLFQYDSPNDEAARVFEDFRYVLGEKLPQLSGELLEGDVEAMQLSWLAELSLLPVTTTNGNRLEAPSERISNLANRRRYWETTGALALLTGRIKQKDARALTIRSNFFLGALGKVLGHETLALELPATADAYETTNDSHSIAILTVLAMEILYPAKTDGDPACENRAEVFYVLNQASLRTDAVASENRELGERLRTIVSAALEAANSTCSG